MSDRVLTVTLTVALRPGDDPDVLAEEAVAAVCGCVDHLDLLGEVARNEAGCKRTVLATHRIEG